MFIRLQAWVALVWSVRNITESALINDYESLIREYGKDYTSSNAVKMDKVVLKQFFEPYPVKTAFFENLQPFDWEGFYRLLIAYGQRI
ncbi:MAG: hypothetical protein REH83_01525 [Rickettsiella sp.]|nr:hypothetical protein [Rickettsiella sp.]